MHELQKAQTYMSKRNITHYIVIQWIQLSPIIITIQPKLTTKHL